MGPNNRRSREDEKLMAAFNVSSGSRSKKGFVIDTRTNATIASAKAKGGGQEYEAYYFGWKKINKAIDRLEIIPCLLTIGYGFE